jgi:hypothetical protein
MVNTIPFVTIFVKVVKGIFVVDQEEQYSGSIF